jgi:predicted nuclease of restriction endonuclease-like RecB superfamily
MSKAGARGGKRMNVDGIYFRSSWEANYSRYLNWLISVGEIAKWEFEPDTFEFFKIKKGNRFYVPDFKVTNNDGSIEYHEVKGWMDPRSKTKLDRMNRYYHDVKIVLIDADAYHAIAKQMRNLIPNWER